MVILIEQRSGRMLCITSGGLFPMRVPRLSLLSPDLWRRWAKHQNFAVMLEIERLRLVSGLSAQELCEKAGVAERGYFKWLKPWIKGTGRTPSEETLDTLLRTVSNNTLTLAALRRALWAMERSGRKRRPPLALDQGEYERRLFNLTARHERDRRSGYREHLRRHLHTIGPRGVDGRCRLPAYERRRVAALGGAALALKMTPEQRSARARIAAAARWRKP